jgi:membrane protease YdiL (CAAX protease family)
VAAAAAAAQGFSGATASPPAAATAAAAAPLFDYAALAALRALVVAPIGEEWVFRCNIIPIFVAAHIAPAAAVALSAVAFGGAHVHHAIEQRRLGHAWSSILASTALQLSYTSLFGVIAGIMLLRTGSAVGIILMHAFCNAMGLPSPTWLQGGGDGEGTQSPFWRWRHAFMAAYALGIFGFVAILAFGFGERQHQCVGLSLHAQLG